MPEPRHNKGKSKQDYQTPDELIYAILLKLRVSSFTIDLAASSQNTVAETYYSMERSALSLEHPWNMGEGWAWCNPPFAHIEPWVNRAYYEQRECGTQTAMLLPAGVGSNWFKRYVHEKCRVVFLNGRITFKKQPTCYPKDCLLLLYGPSVRIGYEVWSWQTS